MRNKVYLLIMDDSFDDEDLENYKIYTSAFFDGVEIEILRQGDEVPGKLGKKVPSNFYKDCRITNRERIYPDESWTQYMTCGKNGINNVMK